VHGPDGMLKPGVVGARIYEMGQTELPYSAQTLKPGMLDQVKNNIKRDFDKSVNGIIDDFQLVGGGKFPHKAGLWPQNYVFIAIIRFVSAKKQPVFC
jgi:hypothetical protein